MTDPEITEHVPASIELQILVKKHCIPYLKNEGFFMMPFYYLQSH